MIRTILCLVLTLVSNPAAAQNPAVMKLVSFTAARGNFHQGTAVLTSWRSGCLTTNYHVAKYSQVVGVTLRVILDNNYHDVVLKPQRTSEDLALVCFPKGKIPVNLPAAIRPSRFLPDWSKNCTGVGFPRYVEGDRKDDPLPQQSLQMRVVSDTTTLDEASAAKFVRIETEALKEVGILPPQVPLSRSLLSAVFTDRYDIGMNYGGISGGALLDSEGRLLGITTMSHDDGNGLFAIPLEKIPKQFFD